MLRFINKHKNFLRRLHRWLGLLSGIVVFIVALTGAIYAFEHEINVWLDSGVHRKVAVENKAIISALEVEKVVRQKYEKDIARMSLTVYPAGDEGIICWVMNKERQWTAFIMNPYSGEVIDRYEWAVNFWAVILELHTSLMIPEIGHDIVAISTVIFAIMMSYFSIF